MPVLTCLQCPTELPKGRKKFCSRACSNKYYNDRQVWSERPDRERHNARKKARYDADPIAAAEKMRLWRAAHPEQQKAIEQRRRQNHRDQLNANCRKWHAEHKDEVNPRRLQWHHSHKEEANSKRRAHYHAHSEENKPVRYEKSQAARLTVPWRALLKAAKWRAAKKSVPFDLTEAWAKENWTGICALSGIPFRLGGKESGPKFFSPSIDRIIPSLGYVETNCRFILWAVNAMKYDGTDSDLYELAEAILKHRTKSISSPSSAP